MKSEVRKWSDVEANDIKKLFLSASSLPYAGTPLANPRLLEYLYDKAAKQAELCPSRALAVVRGGEVRATCQYRDLDYLVDWFKIRCIGIDHLAYSNNYEPKLEQDIAALLNQAQKQCEDEGVEFVTLNVPAAAISLIRGMESLGYKYAEGYLQMVSDTNTSVEQFEVPGLSIRDAEEKDLSDIRDVYSRVQWPSHLTTEPGFDKEKAFELYFKQMRELYKNRGARVKLMIGELDGKFAAALSALVDEDLFNATGMLTNPRHGMALVVHPEARRKGISTHMVAHRQRWYKNIGVEWVDFTPNFNNTGMIRSLEKLGFKYGSVRMTFHKWLRK